MKPDRTLVKICGLKTPDAMTAALTGADGKGTDFVGLVFHLKSPRYVETEVAAYLASYIPASVTVCGLFVDPDDQKLEEILSNVRIDMIQLHGDETPERIAAIKSKFGKPVMKALPISTKADLDTVKLYEPVCDWLLLDAKGTDDMPGGNGLPFDWAILEGFKSDKPWMLAGGLTPENVYAAILQTRPPAVDVSSGVEIARGVKDPEKIQAFLKAAHAARQD